MKIRWFLRDQWRVVLFFAVGYSLMLAVVWLAVRSQGLGLGKLDAAYAVLLGIVSLAGYLFVEYLVRRPFHVEIAARLNGSRSNNRQGGISSSEGPLRGKVSDLDEASTFQTYQTQEQRLFLKLLHKYHDSYVVSLNELQSRQAFYEQFTTRFAHQMKTPLTVLQLLVQELEQGLRDGAREAHHGVLSSMREELIRLDTALGTMLHTARLTSFEFDTHMELVDVVAVIRQVINEHKTQWIRRSIYPRIEAKNKVLATTDKKWLLFMADQIVRNTLQYGYKIDSQGNPTGEQTAFVVKVEAQPDAIRIHFTDQGIGIPARDVRRVFDPFYTGSNGRTHSRATGMGLYLVKEVATRLGHKVSIESVEAEGTTVTITMMSPDYHRPARSEPARPNQ